MRICIWFALTDAPWGGGNQFLSRLAGELTDRGHEVVYDPNDHPDVVLVNAFLRAPGRLLRPGLLGQLRCTGRVWEWSKYMPGCVWPKAIARGPAIVHRLDGVAQLVRGFRSNADGVQAGVNRLSDYTIFQSEYCRKSFREHGVSPADSCLVYNGVDPVTFYSDGQAHTNAKEHLRLIAVSWSDNPRKGFARLAEFSRLPRVEVRFAGNWCKTVDPANVEMLGAISSDKLADEMRDVDAMIHAALNEPCSNAILESLACGLPVMYLDSGGSRELAGNYGVALSDNPAEDVTHFLEQYATLRERTLADRERFLIGSVADKYVEAFQHAIELRK